MMEIIFGKGGRAGSGAALGLVMGILCMAGCQAPTSHFVTSDGRPMGEIDYLWEEVDKVFPGALPNTVRLVMVGGPHASFMHEVNSIGIPTYYKSNIRRGKICRELTHLALHYLSGGEGETLGRCFDNDVRFLEQAVAGYMDRKAAGILEKDIEETLMLAAEWFEEGKLDFLELRDWESFFYRGRWSDQFREWNLDGLRILVTLGDYLDRTYGLSMVSLVFERLDDDLSLDQAVKEVFGIRLEGLLADWQKEVMARAAELSREDESGSEPAE